MERVLTRARGLATHPQSTPGSLIRESRRLRLDVLDTVTYAVLTERAQGASWEDVAEALGETVEFTMAHYGPIEHRWKRGQGIMPWGEGEPPQVVGG